MKEDVQLCDQTTLHLPEHEVLLSFNNDSGKELYYNFWWSEGKLMFDKYCQEEGE